ncbi:MAG: hypothetical protein RSD32_04245 [Oscillospiraceae bacterium]
MKKAWKIVLLLAAFMCGLGLICAVISLFMGGSFSELFSNELAAATLKQISPEGIWNGILVFFGA